MHLDHSNNKQVSFKMNDNFSRLYFLNLPKSTM
jgi:hypothetical protein